MINYRGCNNQRNIVMLTITLKRKRNKQKRPKTTTQKLRYQPQYCQHGALELTEELTTRAGSFR